MLFIVGAEESDIRSHHSVRKVVLSVHIALLVMQNENNKVCHLVVFVPVCQVLYLLFSKTILAEIIYDIVQRLISDIQLVFTFVVVVVELFEITIILEFLGRNEFQTGIFLNIDPCVVRHILFDFFRSIDPVKDLERVFEISV